AANGGERQFAIRRHRGREPLRSEGIEFALELSQRRDLGIDLLTRIRWQERIVLMEARLCSRNRVKLEDTFVVITVRQFIEFDVPFLRVAAERYEESSQNAHHIPIIVSHRRRRSLAQTAFHPLWSIGRMNITEMLQTLSERAGATATVKNVYGEPIS